MSSMIFQREFSPPSAATMAVGRPRRVLRPRLRAGACGATHPSAIASRYAPDDKTQAQSWHTQVKQRDTRA